MGGEEAVEIVLAMSPRDGEESLTTSELRTKRESVESIEQLNESEVSGPVQRNGIRVSLACVPCRSRHVKCGAEVPYCKRCVEDDKSCFYAKSRRGMRSKNGTRKKATAGIGNLASGSSTFASTDRRKDRSYSATPLLFNCPLEIGTKPMKPSRRGGRRDNLIDLYYNYFHKGNPFVLPRYALLARLESDPESIRYLTRMMQWVGSLYAEDVPSTEFRDIALNRLDLLSLPPNGFTVQTLLMAAIAVTCQDEREFGRALLDRAIFLALELRMNYRAFAIHERDPVLAESWRRTWWIIYSMEGMFTAIAQGELNFLCDIEIDVELPCEESEYESTIPRSRTLAEYDARDFEEQTTQFSSFTYFIDLSRIGGAIFRLSKCPRENLESEVANADAMLVSWKLHMPREKQISLDKTDEIDEILFQSHVLAQVLHIHLHRPLSQLYIAPLEYDNGSMPSRLLTNSTEYDDHTRWIHTLKALEAAEIATKLLALPCTIVQHTPLSIYAISMATLANLSGCAYVVTGQEWSKTRDRVRLGLGALKTFGTVWIFARRLENDAKKLAREVFAMERPNGNSCGDFTAAPVPESAPRTDYGHFVPLEWHAVENIDYSLVQGVGAISGVDAASWGAVGSFSNILDLGGQLPYGNS